MSRSRPRWCALALAVLGVPLAPSAAHAAVSFATPPSVTDTIALPERTGTAQLYQQAYDPATGLLYVADTGNARVNVVYTAKATRESTGAKYVTEGEGGAKVDPKPNAIVKRIHAGFLRGESIEVYGLGIDPSTHRVYGTATRDERLVIIQGNDGTAAGSAGELVKTASLGAQARDVAVDPKTHRVYVSLATDAAVAELDGATGRILRTFDATGGDPDIRSTAGLTANFDQGVLYAANLYSGGDDRTKPGAVTVIDLAGGDAEQTIATGAPRATRLAYDPQRHHLFVTSQGAPAAEGAPAGTGSVTTFRVDTTGADAGELSLVRDTPTAPGALGAAVDVSKGLVYSTDYGAKDPETPGTVTVLDASTGEKVAQLGVGARPLHTVVDEASDLAYVTNQADATISVIDAGGAAPKVSATLPQPIRTGDNNVYQSALNPKTGLLYVADPGAQRIRVIYTAAATRDSTNGRYVIEPRGGGAATDPAPNTVVKSIDIPGGDTFEAVLGLAINTRTNTLYGSTPTPDGTFYAIDGRTDTIKATLKLGEKGATREVRVDEARNLVYATQPEGKRVVVIDGNTNAAIRRIDVAPQDPSANFPGGIALNPERGLAYVATPNFAIAPGAPKVDGSIHVIDLASGTTVQSVRTGEPSTINVAYDAEAGKLFATSQGPVDFAKTPLYSPTPGSVTTWAIDPATGRVGERRSRAETAIGALGMTLDAPRGVAYSTDYGLDKPDARTVSVLSRETGEKIGSVAVGRKPLHVSVAPDDGTAYVTNQKDATVSVVAPGTLAGARATLPKPRSAAWPTRRRLRVAFGAGTVDGVRVSVRTRQAVRLPGRARARVLTVARTRELEDLDEAGFTARLRLTRSGRALRALGRPVSVRVRVAELDGDGAVAPVATELRLAAPAR